MGFSLVFALASAFVFLLPLMVGVLTWCEFSEKVDLDSIRQAADEKLQDMNNKMADLKEKAQVQAAAAAAAAAAATQKAPAASQDAEQAPAATPAASAAPSTVVATASPAPAAPAAPACPQCHGTVQAGDRFCEHCGHKLV